MINKEFYTFCRIGREAADTIAKRNALRDVYAYMKRSGTETKGFIEYRIRTVREPLDIEAYQWVLSVFNGPSLKSKEVPEQLSLF